MLYSKLFGKTIKESPKDETSINAKLLIQAGFIRKEVAGVYNFLPLGLKVLNKISNIVREEMNNSGGQELLLVSLQNKSNWEKTGRWDTFDALFKVKTSDKHPKEDIQLHFQEFALGPTHEEVLVPIAREFVSSYRDLPLYLYQIQTKFRDEARAKAGLLRGREFLMKDLYSFHHDEKDLMEYYEKMKKVYANTFKRLGLLAIETKASGGTFSDFSHEYQVVCKSGEDEIIYCPGGDFAQNTEITKVKEGKECDLGHGPLKKVKTIEVGNIFPLKDKFSKALGLTFKDKNGREKHAVMGCYGIGISRVMGAIVEVHNDEKGIVWPKAVAPFDCHLLVLGAAKDKADKAYQKLIDGGIDVLYDDREDASAGQKFADADLIGISIRLVISDKVPEGQVEWKQRNKDKAEVVSLSEAVKRVKRESLV